ncbi:MAG: ABC transporter permease [Candidatus Margulisbacteria bacterium]|jgi:putative ABC transport system permease protein|nr:ABC transporter permease [Candidatus Margulisiibacteriota bacterium]
MINIYQVAYKNLLRKKARSALTITGIALSAWVLVSLFGFNNGYEQSLNRDIDNLGYQLIVTAKGCPYEAATLMLKGGTGLRYLKENLANEIVKNREVEQVTPMLMQVVLDPNKGESGGLTAFLGVDPASYPPLKTFLKFEQGSWFKPDAQKEVVLGYEAAELEQREVGDIYLLPGKNIELKVAGILKRTGTQDDGTIFVPIKTLQQAFGRTGQVTGLGIKVAKDADIVKFEDKMYNLPDVQVVSLIQVKQTILNLVGTAKVMVLSIAIIAIVIALLGVINTVLMSVLERYQEIGILKSIGAMPLDIFRMVWTETLILCGIGSLVGIALALLLAQLSDLLIRRIIPYAPSGVLVQVDSSLMLFTLLIMVLIGLLGGIYPAWRAANIRPLEAIRTEGE